MRTIKRELRSAANVFAVVAAVSAITNRASAQALHFGPTMFRAESGDSITADTATLIVRENRTVSTSRNISIAVLRLHASPARREGTGATPNVPLVYVSGGSGAGISALGGPRFSFFLALRELGDVIVLDLRGSGRSRPRLACDTKFELAMDTPLTRDMLVSATRAYNKDCGTSLRAAGFDVAAYNGREIVEDLESLRLALGAPKVRLLGTSTGTHIALEYVRRHGSRVASVALLGTEGPGMTEHSPSGMDGVLRAMDSDSAGAGIMALFRDVVAKLDTAPVIVPVPDKASGAVTRVGVGGYDARVFVASTFGDRAQMRQLKPLLGALKAGQLVPLAGVKLRAMRSPFQSPFESLHDCQAGTATARAAQVRTEATSAMLGYATLDFAEACDAWGAKQLDSSFQSAVRSTVPALFVSGTLDGRTPVRNADEVRSQFPNSVHLILEGASHGDDLFLSSPSILSEVIRFFKAPAAGPVKRVRIF